MLLKLCLLFMLPACFCAWSQTGEDLLRDCEKGVPQGTNATLQDTSCVYYLKGFVAGLDATQVVYTAPLNGAAALAEMKVICLPKGGISPEQARRIVVKYLHDHPEQLHQNEALVIWVALAIAFPPCK
jgi:hypothetical protein